MPNYQRIGSLRIGQTLREQFEADLAIEYDVLNRLKPGIVMCRVDSLAVLIRQWLLDHLAVAPGLKRQPDHQFEAALQHVTDAVLVQRDWYEDLGDLSESRQLAATT